MTVVEPKWKWWFILVLLDPLVFNFNSIGWPWHPKPDLWIGVWGTILQWFFLVLSLGSASSVLVGGKRLFSRSYGLLKDSVLSPHHSNIYMKLLGEAIHYWGFSIICMLMIPNYIFGLNDEHMRLLSIWTAIFTQAFGEYDWILFSLFFLYSHLDVWSLSWGVGQHIQ